MMGEKIIMKSLIDQLRLLYSFSHLRFIFYKEEEEEEEASTHQA